MSQFDADVAVTESFNDPMNKCLKSEIMVSTTNDVVSEKEGMVKRELEQVQEKGILVKPTQVVYMDDVDRLDHSFYSSSVLGSEEEKTIMAEEASYSVAKKGEKEVSENIKMSMMSERGNCLAAETLNSGGEKDDFVHLKVGSLDQKVEVINAQTDCEKLGGALTKEAHGSDANAEVEVLDLKISASAEIEETLDNRVLESSSSAAEKVGSDGDDRDAKQTVEDSENEPLFSDANTGGQNLESIGDVPAGDEVAAVDDKSFVENQELEMETAPHSSNVETKIADHKSVSIMDNDIADIAVTVDETKSSDFPRKDENMEPVVEVSAEDGQLIESDLKPSQDCADGSEETTAMEVEEVLNFEEKVATDDVFCDTSLGESQNIEPVVGISAEDGQLIKENSQPSQDCADDLEETTAPEVEEVLKSEEKVAVYDDFCDDSLGECPDLVVDKIRESNLTHETQLVGIDGEATGENEKEYLTSDTKSNVNGDKYLHKDEEQLKTATFQNVDAEQFGINGRSDTFVIDSQEIPQASTENTSHEFTYVLENTVESKIGTSGETLVDEPSVCISSPTVGNQKANISNVNESLSPSVGPCETQPETLENLEDYMVCSDLPSATHVSDFMNSDEVVNEDIIESYEDVESDSQGRVLNRCTHGSLVVDLDVCMGQEKQLVKEDIRMNPEMYDNLGAQPEVPRSPFNPQSNGPNSFESAFTETGSGFIRGDLGAYEEKLLGSSSDYPQSNINSASDEICLGAGVHEKHTAEDLDIEMSEQITEPEQGSDVEVKVSNLTTLRPRPQVDLVNHLLPEESEAELSVSDLVWGKVKNHPWWPGQIFDPEDASEKAMQQHHKKGSYLVAYFGDRTFAWNEASVLKPFWSNFSHIEKQSSSEVFQTAINSALDEVSRRIVSGLACSCIPNDIYSKVECQIVENTGICEESSRKYFLDESTGATFFRPNKLVEYMKALAESPSSGTDRLGLVIAKAQLLAFNQIRGRYSLPEFQYCGGLLESDDADNSVLDQENECTLHDTSNKKKLEGENRTSNKRKHNLKDGSYSSKRERRLSEIMGNGGSMEQDKRISFYAAKVSSTASPIPKPSFKVGDCIRRAASQLTGSLSILRNGNENLQKVDGIVDMQTPHANSQTSPVENSSLDEMLVQLQMLARDPVKGQSSENSITTFFSGFRDSIRLCQYAGRQGSVMGKPGGGRKRKVTHASVGSPEEFEFDDVSDSYWTDMIIQNHSEEQPGSAQKRVHYEIVALDAGKSHKSSQKTNSRKRFSTGNHHEMAVDEPISYIDQMRQANLPTELILNFSEADSVPTEKHLIKTFRRFGPLKENETEVNPETSRAKVVFKRCSDAEVAYNSAGKFSIFSPVFVNYQLNYTPSISFNSFPLATSEGLEDAG